MGENHVNKEELTRGQKVAKTLREKYGDDYFSKIGKKSSQSPNSSDNRPFRDVPGAASKAVRARWAKYREAQEKAKKS